MYIHTLLNLKMKATTETLSALMCQYIDTPESGKDCSKTNLQICIQCPVKGSYSTGETIDDFSDIGHLTCLLLWSIIIMVGVLGLLGNIVIIKVLIRKENTRAFNLLLIFQAATDGFCCVIAIVAATATIAFFENWDGRGVVSMYLLYLTSNTLLFGRSASIFCTVMTSIERYLTISVFHKSKSWFTGVKTKIVCICVLVLAVLLAIPRFSSYSIQEIPYTNDNPSLKGLTYLIKSSVLYQFWHGTLYSAHEMIDLWLPLPLLIIFTSIAFWNSRKTRKTENYLMISRETIGHRDLSMFLPVVIAVLIFNSALLTNHILVQFEGVQYREMYMVVCLFSALNSSIKFPFYYFGSSKFQRSAQVHLFICFATIEKSKPKPQNQVNNAIENRVSNIRLRD